MTTGMSFSVEGGTDKFDDDGRVKRTGMQTFPS